MISKLIPIVRENRSLLLFILLMIAFRSSIADWNEVPTGSMKPTIIEGDRILVNKLAYDVRLPLTHISLYKRTDPVRGDIVVFDSKEAGKRLVKRVVGVPGDNIAMIDNVLSINGTQLDYVTHSSQLGSQLATDRIENLLGIEHPVRLAQSPTQLATFGPITVPDEHYLVLGDNRDNSTDSRVIGFVPRHEIVGRTRQVVISLDYDNYYIPRHTRILHTL